MNKYDYIKEAVELNSEIKDLCVKGRQRYRVDVRFVYMKLCRDFDINRFSASECARAIGMNHSNVLHGIKEIDINLGKNWFLANHVYTNTVNYLTETVNIDRVFAEVEIKNFMRKAMALMKAVDKQVVYEDESLRFVNIIQSEMINSRNVEYELIAP